MFTKLKISSFLLKRLERIKQQCSGCLFGIFYGDGTLMLIGFNVESTIGQLNYEQIQHKFPAEVDLCGLVKFGDCTDTEAHLSEIFKDVDITDNPIMLHCELGTLVGLRAAIFLHGKLQDIPYEVMEAEQLYRDFCFTRLQCHLNIYTEQNSQQAVRHEIHALRKMLSCGRLAFHVASTRIFLTSAGARDVSSTTNGDTVAKQITNDSFIADVIHAIAEAVNVAVYDAKENTGRKQSGSMAGNTLSAHCGAIGSKFDIINIDVLNCKTRERPIIDDPQASITFPAMSMRLHREERKICIPLDVEAMAVLCKQTPVSRLYDILIESICRSLRLFEQSIIDRLEESQTTQLMVPRSYHFYPQEFGYFMSCAYLDGVSDDVAAMQEKRKKLHRHFALPVTRPYFRRANRVLFQTDLPIDAPLLNTHVGLKPSGISNGKQYFVQGNYFYYHYMQQKIQDKGWGCAYRSLQTICSWFQLQGYTERAMLTHLEIQKYLVDIGDKPQSFAGSTRWIGSTEVSMCLHGLLNVESKILHVGSGADLATAANDLVMHYQAQGTPVMIGGGVLAHTIIGIDYCVQTGELKFLILDPHYTGDDDLQTIQAKGWCGWKGIDFWDKKSYYNLCMPQRPLIF